MIKFIFISLTIILILVQIDCISKHTRLAYVNSEEGLILRELPSKKSNKILVIPNNSEIEILDSSIKADQINDKKGNWVKARYMNNVGYLFDAYLSINKKNDLVKFCNNSEYKIQNLKETNYSKNQNVVKKLNFNNKNFFELRNSKNNSYMIAEIRNKYFTSGKRKESIYGNFENINNFLISEWDDTQGDFSDSGFNLYFILNDNIRYIQFHPFFNTPTCYHSVIASYAYPNVENRITNESLISKVSYPECDFENPPENIKPDNPVETIPTKFKRESMLIIKFDNDKLNISEFCDEEINEELLKLWESGKRLHLIKL